MIQIVKNGPGPWPEYVVEGTAVIISCHGATMEIDCAARQKDSRVTIDITHGEGSPQPLIEGAASGSYVASLIIPPAKYTDPEAPPAPAPGDEAEEGMGGMFEGGEPAKRIPLAPADMIAVALHLFTLHEDCEARKGA